MLLDTNSPNFRHRKVPTPPFPEKGMRQSEKQQDFSKFNPTHTRLLYPSLQTTLGILLSYVSCLLSLSFVLLIGVHAHFLWQSNIPPILA